MKTSFAQQLNLFLLLLSGLLLCAASSAMAQNSGSGMGMDGMGGMAGMAGMEGMEGMEGMSGMGGGMDDMMGGRGRPAPSPLQTAIESLRQTTDKTKRTKIQTKINDLLSRQYDSYLKQNESELDKMEQRLKNLRTQLERRRSAKELLVELELKRIVNEADGLAWPANPAGSSFGGDDYSDYGGGGGYDEGGDLLGGLLGGDSYEAMGGMPSRSSVGKTKNLEQLLQELIAAQKELKLVAGEDFHEQKDSAAETPEVALRRSALACINHESAHQRFPSNIIGPDGKALLSWRVAILPFLSNEGILLYKKFHLDEPWYSEHNKTLLKEIPNVFKNIKEEGTKTSILGFEMEGALFENDKQFTFANITDGSSNTILVVNAADELAVEWTKPADISLGDYKSREPKQLFRSGKVNVALCDASTHQMSEDVDGNTLQHLILRNDGETVNILNASKK